MNDLSQVLIYASDVNLKEKI